MKRSSNFAQKQFLEYEEATKIVQSFGIVNRNQYKKLFNAGKFPKGMPSHPDEFYSKEYKPGKIPFEEARKIAREMKLERTEDYLEIARKGKLPPGTPSTPNMVYKDEGWIDWYDYLGTGMLPFEEAKKLVRKLGIKNSSEYKKLKKQKKLPKELPQGPEVTYKKQGWIDWYDYLGTGRTTQKNLLPFKEAKEVSQKLKIKNRSDYVKRYRAKKLPKGMPSDPHKVYGRKF